MLNRLGQREGLRVLRKLAEVVASKQTDNMVGIYATSSL